MTNTRSQVKTRQDETRRLLRLRNRNRVALHRQFRCWVETEEIAKSLAPEELENIHLRMKEEKQVAYDWAKEAMAGSRITLAVLIVQFNYHNIAEPSTKASWVDYGEVPPLKESVW